MSAPCQVHAFHSPHVTECDVHHVWPQALGGPSVASNLVTVCPTGHRNVHELFEEYSLASGTPPWTVLEHWGAAERELAARGWTAWQASLVI